MTEDVIELPKRKIKSIIHDAEKAAQAANLVYVSDNDAELNRVKNGDGFKYMSQDQKFQKNIYKE